MTHNDADHEDHFIVGVGASAGGLQAIEQMFKLVPVDTGMSFVVVQHLSPDFRSLMVELLSRWTDMPVHRVEDGITVEPNSIYLIPPRKEMVISQRKLLLTDRDPLEGVTLPIDHFFRSLARDAGKLAVAIVLSGTGTDGSRGIVDVHEAGGLAIAQRHDTAKFDGMPIAAKNTGICDLLLPPDAMAHALIEYAKDPSPSAITAYFQSTSLEASGLEKVFALLQEEYDNDFSQYKLSTIVRRIERRMVVHRISHIDKYADLLSQDQEESQALYRDLLIGVTRFFRDREAFDELAEKVIDPAIEKAEPGEDIRVWVAGCSTGEEAYSVAMLFQERLALHEKEVGLKIFATDIDEEALDFATIGLYPFDSFADMRTEWRDTYFSKTVHGYQITPAIRKLIVFAKHNILTDAPFTRLDIICCRNLLIYFRPLPQTKLLSLFHFGLRSHGALMMGASESPGELSDEFLPVSSKLRIYRKRRNVQLPAVSLVPAAAAAMQTLRPSGLPSLRRKNEASDSKLLATYAAALDRFIPPSVLVDESGRILHTFAGAGKYLTSKDGRFSAHVFDRVDEDLGGAISHVMSKAIAENRTATHSPVKIQVEGGELRCVVSAHPIEEAGSNTRSFLIQLDGSLADESTTTLVTPTSFEDFSAEHFEALEAELRFTKESLQATIEELETSNEELQATNEELVASNEELQSTNEELHSVNEELYTVNSEFQNKIIELSELTRDMDNLLQCTQVHTIFLDRELRIRKFTPSIAAKFNFLPQDIGRRIDSFTHNIVCDDISERISGVIASGEISEDEVQDAEGHWFLMRILPYLEEEPDSTSERKVLGALLTLVDVSKLREFASALEDAVQQRDGFLAMLSHELRNPLAAVLNALNVLRSGQESRWESAVEVVHRQASQMAALLDDLLDVTRVSQGKIRLEKSVFDLREIIDPAIESIQPLLNDREQVVDRLVASEPLWVSGSHGRLVQVLVNLLSNASKYSPSGEDIVLEVQSSGSEAIIRVADNGVGIREDLVGRVFEMFAQAQRTLDRSDGGLGVGLTLVRSLVELHSGSVVATSPGEGEGSEFAVRLPTVRGNNHSKPQVLSPDLEAGGGRSIVLIEDNLDAAAMLKFLLEDAGFQVTTAHDGLIGYELIQSKKPDIAIVDIGIPTISGFEVAKRVAASPLAKSIQLIALTGYGQESDRQAAFEAGFHAHLVKPLNPAKLNEVLRQAEIAINVSSSKV